MKQTMAAVKILGCYHRDWALRDFLRWMKDQDWDRSAGEYCEISGHKTIKFLDTKGETLALVFGESGNRIFFVKED